jgi:2'-5' RNA ligase
VGPSSSTRPVYWVLGLDPRPENDYFYEMIRLFAALEVPFDVAEGLAPRQVGVPGARWRPTDAFHITLRFFGEVSEPVAANLDDALALIFMTPFEAHLDGAGAFGEQDHMRALWAGVAASEPLTRLAGKCETAARKMGLKPEKRTYRPHVTLAYLTGGSAPRVAAWIAEHNLLRSPPWTVRRFGLYSSQLGPDGSKYTLEREYPIL